ncbi:DNA adenine methylase [Phenylobacterium sp. 58.2.17]|uniref:DNA adenine methylase n=1 Tax=Phenylobacterium sp. 58.2.17 TaxID=2969306 RepID=UPI00226482A2|nr:DNA adenine methylase [Phenylobacterium sp. 58.2.17]MCX7586526.1 DNA adenine methylase [Phenylobacterium sp. 58.2.17]
MVSSPPFAPVRPVKPAAPYIGGKRNLARVLVDLIETVPHRTYAEPFVGMGGVFLRRRQRPAAEVINDLSRDVWTFYRVLQEHYPYFMDMLRWRLTSRAEFERLVAVDPATLTDLQRAARFLYLQRTAFGGKVSGRNFGVSHHRSGRFDVTRLETVLADLQERLAGVIIERLDWAAFLARYDSAETLFYLDPPYFDCEGDYGPDMFEAPDFERMADQLAGLQGRFILSLNDRPEVRAIFARFQITGVDTHYGVAGKGAAKAQEVIITR